MAPQEPFSCSGETSQEATPRGPWPALDSEPLAQNAGARHEAGPQGGSAAGGREPALPAFFPRGHPRSVGSMLRAPSLVVTGGWAARASASSSSGRVMPPSAFAKAPGVAGETPATSSLPETGEPLRASLTAPGAEEGLGRALELARGRNAARNDLFQEAMSMLSRLEGELVDVDASLETEGLRLAREEARAADYRREADEEREQELRALNAALERQIQARRAALAASPSKAPSDEKEVQEREEVLALETLEHSLALERLEVRERQAATAEDAVAARDARIQQEKLELQETCFELQQTELEGRTFALRTKLDAAEQRERAAREAQASAQDDLASARTNLSSLQQQVEAIMSLAEKIENEASHRRTMQCGHSMMLKDLRVIANGSLDTICEEGVSHPREDDDASHHRFFTEIVSRLEDRAVRAHELVEERSRGLLGRAFSRVFSHLLNLDPHFDFNVVIAPVPGVIQGNLAGWVDDHVDDLVAEFAPEDGAVVIAAKGGGVGDDDQDNASSSASGADDDDEDDAGGSASG
nr:uncharacterized protein LOC109745593 [Aegilops tauschii subsp. strangulata]